MKEKDSIKGKGDPEGGIKKLREKHYSNQGMNL